MTQHHRRKPGRPLSTHGPFCRIISIRLPYELEKALKAEAAERGRPWQTVLKELLTESLGIAEPVVEVNRSPATALQAAAKRLKKP